MDLSLFPSPGNKHLQTSLSSLKSAIHYDWKFTRDAEIHRTRPVEALAEMILNRVVLSFFLSLHTPSLLIRRRPLVPS